MPWTILIGSTNERDSRVNAVALDELTQTVFVDFNRTIVDLGEGNDFNMIPVTALSSFPFDVVIEVFRDVSTKEVPVLHLE